MGGCSKNVHILLVEDVAWYFYVLAGFCLVVLIVERGILQLTATIMDLSNFPFNLSVFVSHMLQLYCSVNLSEQAVRKI